MEATDREESAFYSRTGDGYVCGLCPHRCRIPFGRHGICGSRRADRDFLAASGYGIVSSLCVDPMEKKPLYHYRPGSECLSVGGLGCNMRCRHCQNHAISMPSGQVRTSFVSPEDLATICRDEGLGTIAFTYNEPTISFEYIRDTAETAPDLGIVLVTNGYVCEEPLRELCGIADAMNIDVKGFTEDFYRSVCGANLEDVKRTCETAFSEGVHIELTYLVIPGYNDGPREIEGFCGWAADSLSRNVPIHFSRFHPDNEMTDVPMTSVPTLVRCRETALGCGLRHVYIGNAAVDGTGDTYCPSCGRPAIRRTGYRTDVSGLDGDRCSNCGCGLNIRLRGRTAGFRGPGRAPAPGLSVARTGSSASP